MSSSIHRQDSSGHMPLAVCLNGAVIDRVAPGTDVTDPDVIAQLREAAAADIGVRPEYFEILATCHRHPNSSAVDCLACEPV